MEGCSVKIESVKQNILEEEIPQRKKKRVLKIGRGFRSNIWLNTGLGWYELDLCEDKETISEGQ